MNLEEIKKACKTLKLNYEDSELSPKTIDEPTKETIETLDSTWDPNREGLFFIIDAGFERNLGEYNGFKFIDSNERYKALKTLLMSGNFDTHFSVSRNLITLTIDLKKNNNIL